MTARWRCLPLLLALVGCASSGAGGRGTGSDVDSFLGDYTGSFASALSPHAEDDLNFGACDQTLDDCKGAPDPLVDIVLRLTRDPQGRFNAAFYRTVEDTAPLDLLGRGCGTRVGALETLKRDRTHENQRYTARFELLVENRLCAGRLRPTSSHFMLVELYASPDEGRQSRVLIDKAVVNENYTYVVEDGVQRRVRFDLNNLPDNARRGGYRVCIEDDQGEYSRCVFTDKELKEFALALPVPGGVAGNYTWWHDLTPNLKRTKGLYTLEQYIGQFQATAQ